MDVQGIHTRLKKAAITAGATFGEIDLEGCAGMRTVFEIYPRPLETNEVEIFFAPEGSKEIPNIEHLRSFGDVLSGGSVREIILDDRHGLPIRGKLFYARASGADADVELRISAHTVELPPECSCQGNT